MEEEIIYNIKVNGKDNLDKVAKSTKEAGDATKENTDALNKQSAALDNTKFGGVVNGFKGMTTAAKAFIATPIGAVIGALGLAVGALTAYFKGSEEGQNNFNKIVRTGTIVLGNLLDIVRDFGGALFKVFTGDFKGAAEDLRAGFDGIKTIVEDTNAEIAQGNIISKLEAETDVLERQLIVLKATNEARIAELKLKAEDRSLGNAERQAALNEALRLQNELSDKAVQVAKNRLTIVQETNKLSDSTKEDLLEEANLTAALAQVEKDRNDKSKEIFTKNQQLKAEGLKADEEAEAAASQTRLALLRSEREQQLEIERSFELEKITLKTDFNEKALDNTKKLLAANIKAGEEESKARQDQAKIDELVNQNKIQGALSVFRLTSGLAKENTILAKVTGVAQATIDTYIAANKAFALGGGVPFGTVLASLSVALGLANVAKITGIGGFASGGLTGKRIGPNDGTPINRSNGDNLLATVKTGEVILNERQQAMLGGSRTFARLGVPGFAGGGLVSSSSEARKSQNQLTQAIAGMNVVVTVEDINAGFNRVDTINKLAQVI